MTEKVTEPETTSVGGTIMVVVSLDGDVMHNRCRVKRGIPCTNHSGSTPATPCREATDVEIAAARLRGELK